MLTDYIFLIIGFIISWILLALNYSNALTIVLAFLPVAISILCNNSEKVKLFITRIALRNNQVPIILKIKNAFICEQSLDGETFQLEQDLIKLFVKNDIKTGKENNKIRIERQKIRSGKDNNIEIRIPITIYLQPDGKSLYCYMENTMDPITFKDIPKWVVETETVWDLLIEYIGKLVNGKLDLKYTIYDADIKVRRDNFKNVYLANYAVKYIDKLVLNKENSIVKLTNDNLNISSKSKNDFRKEIEKYCGMTIKFFK